MTTKSAPWNTTLIGLSLALCGCLLLTPGQARAFETEIKGFREFKWGDPPSSAMGKNCTPASPKDGWEFADYECTTCNSSYYNKTHCPNEQYGRNSRGLELKIGNNYPSYIEYRLTENKLYDVKIVFDNESEFNQNIYDILTEKYGNPNDFSKSSGFDDCNFTNYKNRSMKEYGLLHHRDCYWKFGDSMLLFQFFDDNHNGLHHNSIEITNFSLKQQMEQNKEKAKSNSQRNYREEVKKSTNDL